VIPSEFCNAHLQNPVCWSCQLVKDFNDRLSRFNIQCRTVTDGWTDRLADRHFSIANIALLKWTKNKTRKYQREAAHTNTWNQSIFTRSCLTLWRPVVPHGHSYKASYARPGWAIICNFWHPGTLTLRAERQSARMSKITNDGSTRPGIGCFIAVPMWHHWASKG